MHQPYSYRIRIAFQKGGVFQYDPVHSQCHLTSSSSFVSAKSAVKWAIPSPGSAVSTGVSLETASDEARIGKGDGIR